MTQKDTFYKERVTLLLATLNHVPFDGWSEAALQAGLKDAGMTSADALVFFPGGPLGLVEFFSHYTDQRMLEVLENTNLADMRIRERIAESVRVRLDLLLKHREASRRALAFLALPQNAALGAKLLYQTVDAIWHACGDTSADFNFYTKRALLAGVYASTLLFWLQDESEDFSDSWAFLDRRIADVMEIQKLRARASALAEKLPDPFDLIRRACL